MTTVEILLMIFGAIIFIASFIVPETKSEMEAVDMQLTKEQIQEMLKEEMKHVHDQVADVVDETVSYSVEKSERALERLTNDKIQAISEYSGTVLTDIHKNHEETMFLYDMLNDKHENLKVTASEVSQAVRQANETVSEVKQTNEQMTQVLGDMRSAVSAGHEKVLPSADAEYEERFLPADAEYDEEVSSDDAEYGEETFPSAAQKDEEEYEAEFQTEDDLEAEDDFEPVIMSGMERIAVTQKVMPEAVRKEKVPKTPAKEAVAGQDGNNNERILALYKQGKSHVEIAKELGLGVGEVKLVIDLYKGM